MREYRYLLRLIIVVILGFLILLNSEIFSKRSFIVNFNIWRLKEQSIDYEEKVNDNLIFLNEKFHWNFNFHSWIDIQIESDISNNIEDFIENNKNHFRNFEEKIDRWKCFVSFGMKIRSSFNENLLIIISELWFTKDPCQIGCQSEKSYLYLEALDANFRRISFNWSMKNIQIPSILRITQPNQSECCSERFYPRLINTDHHPTMFLFNTIDFNKQRQMQIYEISTADQTPILFEQNLQKILIPLIENNKIYLIYSWKPLKIFEYQFNSMKIEMNENWKRFEEGTQFIQYSHRNYFIGLSSIEISSNDCQRISRPHLIILSKIFNEFRLIYISEMLSFDDFPVLRSYSTIEQINSTDFCYGLIRQIIPGSIIQSDWAKDQILLTLSMNHKKTFLIKINGIGRIVQSLSNVVEKNYMKIFSNETIGIEMISYREKKNLEYFKDLIDRKKVEYEKELIEKEEIKSKVIKDVLQSPTYPTFQIVSNTIRQNLKDWIDYDFIHYGLIGRYLTDYNLINRNSGQVQSLMIDAGGNHGMYSLYSLMFNQTVFVFEILPKYWIVIQESIRINPNIKNRIILHKYGVSDQYYRWNVLPDDGTTRLIYPETDQVLQGSANQSSMIEAYPLDRFIFQRVSVMKIDVEGFEIHALKGASRAIRFFGVGAILIEIVPSRWFLNNITITEGISILDSVTLIGHYSNYIIPRYDLICPLLNISNIEGIIPIQNLTMMNMKDGHVEFAPFIYQFFVWKNIIIAMDQHQWGCNFWLERSI